MKQIHLFLIFIIIPVISFGNCEEFIHQFKSNENVRPYYTVIDSDDNFIVSGSFKGSVQIGSDTIFGSDNNDVFLIKFDNEGQIIWNNVIQSSGNSFDVLPVWEVILDVEDNILIYGLFKNYLIFENDTLTATGNFIQFIMKVNSSGNLLWYKVINFNTQPFINLVTDENANILLGLNYKDTIEVESQVFYPVNSNNFMIFKFSPTGNLLWGKNILNVSKTSAFNRIEWIDQDNFIITGFNQSGAGINLEDTFIDVPSTSKGVMYILSLNNEGKFNYILFGTTGRELDFIKHLFKSNDGHIYGAGWFSNTLTIDQFSVSTKNPTSIFESDVFIFKMDMNQQIIWLNNFGSNNSSTYFSDMVIDQFNNLFLTGSFRNNIIIEDSTYSSNGDDLYIVKISPEGSILNVFTSSVPKNGGFNVVQSGGIAINSNDEILLSAYFNNKTYIRDSYFDHTNWDDGLIMKLCDLSPSTGLAEHSNNKQFKMEIYPNPVNDFLYIHIYEHLISNMDIKIYNILGQKIKDFNYNFTDNIITTDVSDLKQGIYFVEVNFDNQLYSKKFIKQ